MTSKINFDIQRERCPGCNGHVLSHHKIMICNDCDSIYHGPCSEIYFKFNHFKSLWQCNKCQTSGNAPERYNPFASSLAYDKYDPNYVEMNDDLRTISNILENCRYYDKKALSYLLKGLIFVYTIN